MISTNRRRNVCLTTGDQVFIKNIFLNNYYYFNRAARQRRVQRMLKYSGPRAATGIVRADRHQRSRSV